MVTALTRHIARPGRYAPDRSGSEQQFSTNPSGGCCHTFKTHTRIGNYPSVRGPRPSCRVAASNRIRPSASASVFGTALQRLLPMGSLPCLPAFSPLGSEEAATGGLRDIDEAAHRCDDDEYSEARQDGDYHCRPPMRTFEPGRQMYLRRRASNRLDCIAVLLSLRW
jgi:hypothetical protein